VIQGGEENPCLAPGLLEQIRARTGSPCPRRESQNADDFLASELGWLGAHAETGHLFRVTWDVATEGYADTERLALLRRISRAYADPEIAAILWPKS
jgi:hypothetical protein